tara:strand:- start:30 stop:434 length:405 start_codon:yes stop_codon:yes gene_type:complete
MAVINRKKKKKYDINNDTLVTFGDEGYTMRKDDPRTEEAIKKSQELVENKIKEGIETGELSMFEGLNMSDIREEDEDFEEFKLRRTTNNNLRKIYRKLGPEECRRQFPMGFSYAIQQAVVDHQEEAKKSQTNKK